MITLLGTNHISHQSVQDVLERVEEHDIIAVELDRQRLQTIFNNQQRTKFWRLTKAVGFSGAVFATVARWVEHKLGAAVGTSPGDEMRAAIRAAATHNKQLALIDQPIQKTLQRFSEAFTWRVKLKLLASAFKRTDAKISLNTTPDEETIKVILAHLDEHLPELADVLVHERNTYMARSLQALTKQHPDKNILAVVGAGHVPGMREELNMLAQEENT